mgnify:CR=1 FL=1
MGIYSLGLTFLLCGVSKNPGEKKCCIQIYPCSELILLICIIHLSSLATMELKTSIPWINLGSNKNIIFLLKR